MSLNDDALEYHARGRSGKIKVIPTKPCVTADDLSLAYSPGVAAPCLEIEKDPEEAYKYTAKGNLVAVISNGSAVLGLGNIGALAGNLLPPPMLLPFDSPADGFGLPHPTPPRSRERRLETRRRSTRTRGAARSRRSAHPPTARRTRSTPAASASTSARVL